ncbi:membrane protein DedA with SNARE-associated domain [Rhodobacter sp. JA431]|uniref:bifunctional DedA family/phosphatase PAP2 family protein n=1 Tax=Rhodobacter sp. JA431 TaxID=570013 RepID=UPI000BD9F2BC|nr:bifunctional DedA family/phosphatase PAP2 family protein [Rhodobacter sp. JA431]SOC21430.1 membrane protein DedA with SNARE-associated domain [Rhodobacter sp. JA431]
MTLSIAQILPSLTALGLFAYWGIGAAAALEAFVLTGIFLPGTLVVEAGGFLAERGVLDVFDLMWFVAIGSMLGGEATFWAGRHLRAGLKGRWAVEKMPAYARAERLFARRGGFALVLGRFAGPVAALVPFAAAIAGMDARRFRLWNVASGIPYAVAHVGLGYALGRGLTHLSPVLTRNALFALGLVVVTFAIWSGLKRLDRGLGPVLQMLGGLLDRIALHPQAQDFGARHPKTARFIAARLDRSHFAGLPASFLALGGVGLLALGSDLARDFVMAEPIVQIDARLAQLMHLFWTPGLIALFTHITALGDKGVGLALLALVALWVLLSRRPALFWGFLVAGLTDLTAVSIAKHAFGRPRSSLGYFVEGSGSFPSGHAAFSVAFFGMLFYILWRLKWLGPMTAAFLAAMTAFLIGLSRLYLVEHYLSDVLAGWILGALCLLAGIAVAEWRESAAPPASYHLPRPQLLFAALISLGLLGYAGTRVASYAKPLKARPEPTAVVMLDAPALQLGTSALPLQAETLTGNDQLPLSLAVLSPSSDALRQALEAQGWTLATKASPQSLAQAFWGDLKDQGAADAALAPLFWQTRANVFALSAPPAEEPADTPRLRLWQTHFADASGRRLWLAALTRDDGLYLDHARPAPDVAAQLAKVMEAAPAALPVITLP